MTGIFKKSTAFLLVLCTVALIILNLAMITGVGISSSAGTTRELWLKEGYEYMAVNTVRKKIHPTKSGVAPWFITTSEGAVDAYIPVSALTSYFGGSYTVSGDTITITNFNSKVFVMTSGELEYTKEGVAEKPLPIPPLVKDGEAYLTTEGIRCAIQGSVRYFLNPDIGLIVLTTSATPHSYDYSFLSLKEQIREMDNLLYTLPSAEELYADIQDYSGVTTHPRLLVNQDRFDEIRAIYEKTGELTDDEVKFKTYVRGVLSLANAYFARAYTETATGADFKDEAAKTYFRQPYYLYDENGKRLYGVSSYEMPDGTKLELTEYWQTVYPWQQSSPNGDGYDLGERSNLDLVSTYLKFFAFAWQITRQQKWADAFYLTAMELCKWEHWGEGHYLDCADGAAEYALGYDWIYPAFSSTAEGRAKLRQMAEGLFILGVEVGYNAAKRRSNTDGGVNVSYTSVLTNITNENLTNSEYHKYKSTLHARAKAGGNWHFAWTNNWQNVCISGMLISALAVMEYSDMKNVCTSLIADYLLPRVEYSVIQYAPDGSYSESPGYWEYATKTFMLTLASLESSAGSSYGILDTVGLRESYYFAANITDVQFYPWNYHDSSRKRINCSTFYLASKLFEDPAIAKTRDIMLNSGLGIGAEIYDVLFYDPSLSEGADGGLELDYYGKNIDTVTMRSSWEKNGIFAGLHAGANNVTHGDIDSGNFYLSTGNVVWFGDGGSEDYNISNFELGDYFDNKYRYLYYNKSIASHNSLFIVGNQKIPRGQIFNSLTNGDAYAKIEKFVSEENGSYAIADLTPSFNTINDTKGSVTSSAKRGLLLTNSRSTVVVQDEFTFKEATDLVWSADSEMIEPGSLSDDGRTVYLRAVVEGTRTLMRATLITEDENLKFRVVTDKSEEFLTYLDTTVNEGKIVTKTNSGNEKASDPNKRLVIEADGVTEFKVAVVFEIINDEREIVGYEMTEMKNWTITSDEWVKDANQWIEDEVKPEYKYSNSDLIKAMAKYDSAVTTAEKLLIARELYDIINSIDPTISGISGKIESCKSYISKLNLTSAKINDSYKDSFFSQLKMLTGME